MSSGIGTPLKVSPALGFRPPSSYPEPSLVRQDDMLSIVLGRLRSERAAEDSIAFREPSEFSGDRTEIRISNPLIVLNGTRMALLPGYVDVRGSLTWIYLPGHGRYVLSLIPRRELGFTRAGYVFGTMLVFSSEGDGIVMNLGLPATQGDDGYGLYVLHEAGWEPAKIAQRDKPQVGSIDPAEIAALRR